MELKIQDFDKQLFLRETGYHATEHPHLYFEWLQIKMLQKIDEKLDRLNQTFPQEGVIHQR